MKAPIHFIFLCVSAALREALFSSSRHLHGLMNLLRFIPVEIPVSREGAKAQSFQNQGNPTRE